MKNDDAKRSRLVFLDGAAALIAKQKWASAAADVNALDEGSLRDDQVAALDLVGAIAEMFGKDDGPTAEERAVLIHLSQELTPMAYRSKDGAKARALERINDVAGRLRATEDNVRRSRLTSELLDYLDDLGFDVGTHWQSRLEQCTQILLRVQVDSGEWRPGAAGLLADLLIAAQPDAYPANRRRHLVDALGKAAKRGAQTM